MSTKLTIGFIGAGNMGGALIAGLAAEKVLFSPDRIICSDPRQTVLDELAQKYGVAATLDNTETIKAADVLVLAVKPQVVADVFTETVYLLDDSRLIISVVAGVSLAAIEKRARRKLRLIKVMPNICATIGQGISALAAGKNATQEDLGLTRDIFRCVGETVTVEEGHLDAVTGLSASGPAYIFMLIDALADAGVNMGLCREDAKALAVQTVLGSAAMVKSSGKHPGALKDLVASPGGTTIAGLHALAEGGIHAALMNAVAAAAERSKVLGKSAEKAFLEEFT